MSHGPTGHVRVRIRRVAQREEFLLTKEAGAAGNGERHHHTVPRLELPGRAGSHFYHFPHELVAQHIARFHGGHQAAIEMQIGPANGSGTHFDNGIACLKNLRVGNRLDANIACAVPTKGFHWFLNRKIAPRFLRSNADTRVYFPIVYFSIVTAIVCASTTGPIRPSTSHRAWPTGVGQTTDPPSDGPRPSALHIVLATSP